MASTVEQLRGLVLSATELKAVNPSWSGAMVEDYLSIIENTILLAGEIDTSVTNVDEIEQLLSNMETSFGVLLGKITANTQKITEAESNTVIDRNQSRINALEKRITELEQVVTL